MERQYLSFEEKIRQAELRDYGQEGASLEAPMSRLAKLTETPKQEVKKTLMSRFETVVYQAKA